jgi:hypothetical protein
MFNPERPPEIIAQRWLNSDTKRTLKAEKGKVVVIAIWQLTCPGSQKFGLPQAMRLRNAFEEDEVAVFALHMPFEKFAEQTPEKVEAYLNENGITIPVALDKPNGEGLPETMKAYELQGTPALLIFDRQGRLRRHYLGAVDDMRLGAEVMGLLIEDRIVLVRWRLRSNASSLQHSSIRKRIIITNTETLAAAGTITATITITNPVRRMASLATFMDRGANTDGREVIEGRQERAEG